MLGRMAAQNVAGRRRCRSSSAPAPTSTTCRRRVDHLIQRSEFLTTYTPYQPEIAQGTLQYLFEFQTQVAMLTGMEVANASMYDGSTGCGRGGADGAPRHPAPQGGALRRPASALRRGRRDRCRAWPATRSSPLPPDVPATRGPRWPRSTPRPSCVVVQTPDVFGNLRDLAPIAEKRARRRRAADRRLHRGRVARPRRAAGRDGRRHRRRRGPVDRQRAELRRALCRPVRHARRNSCARCPAASAARRSTPRAGAASC